MEERSDGAVGVVSRLLCLSDADDDDDDEEEVAVLDVLADVDA